MSQYDEDEIIERLLGDKTGTYVDIGAGHPYHLSNTWALYERGMTGLLIEPIPEMADLLREDRPLDKVEQVAAFNDNKISSFYVGGIGNTTGLSSMNKDWLPSDCIHREIEVVVRRTQDILNCYPEIRDNAVLCSIDVEGSERNVIEGIDFRLFRPFLFVIESLESKMLKPTHSQWENLLIGYEFVEESENGLNRFYRASA